MIQPRTQVKVLLRKLASWRKRTLVAEGAHYLEIDEAAGGVARWRLTGAWTLDAVISLDGRLRALAGSEPARELVIDASGLSALDSAGAWSLRRTLDTLGKRGARVRMDGLAERFQVLLDQVGERDDDGGLEVDRVSPLVAVLERSGRAVVGAADVGRDLLGFFGLTLVTLSNLLIGRGRLRMIALVNQMEAVGLNAMPIVGLLCFLVGIVLAYMGALQLERFGAAILTVNLVGVSVLREIGVLLTAIIVAGRSGSAFTAQIGTMKVNQEVDALETLGLSPVDVLVMPRLLALILCLPLLVFLGDMMGILGGGVIVVVMLDMSIGQFLAQLKGAVDFWDFATGMIKAPVFAYVIALVGCHQGLQVSGSADSVGTRTTRSVVESIFIVIVLDAAFAVFFAELGI